MFLSLLDLLAAFRLGAAGTGCEGSTVHALQADRAPRREARERHDHRPAHRGRSLPGGIYIEVYICIPMRFHARVSQAKRFVILLSLASSQRARFETNYF